MNIRHCTLIAAIAGILAVPALAHGQSYIPISQLAEETGLSERNIRMLLGGRTAYAEYRVVFNKVERQFKQVVGEQRYRELAATGTLSPREKLEYIRLADHEQPTLALVR